MTIKIETKPLKARARHNSEDFGEFVQALKNMKVGQSFVCEYVDSHHRIAMSVAKVWLEAQFSTRREGEKWRVGRVA